MHLPEHKIDKEVLFVEGAKVAKYFESALKCWRIHQPNIIQVEDQYLTDDHIHSLCKFLKDKNMINSLNLRRNLITNKGANEIA
jgi:hypothetical protein